MFKGKMAYSMCNCSKDFTRQINATHILQRSLRGKMNNVKENKNNKLNQAVELGVYAQPTGLL